MAQDRQTAISIVALDAVKPEGNAGTTPFTFRILRTGDLSQADQVGWWLLPSYDNDRPDNFAHDDAAGELWGDAVLAPGESSLDLTIQVVGDSLAEADESFLVILDLPAPLQPGESVFARGTILNDEASLSARADAASIREGDTSGFTIRRNNTDLAPLTVEYDLVPSHAYWGTTPSGEPSDLIMGALSGTIAFAEGQREAHIAVATIQDSVVEPDEVLRLVLRDPSTPIAVDDVVASIWISDDDPFLTIDPIPVSAPEGESASFTIRRHASDLAPLTVEYDLRPPAAGPDPRPTADAADLEQGTLSGTIAFAAGESETRLTLSIAQDTAIEPTEYLTLVLRDPSTPIALPTTTPELRILNDDLDPATDIPASAATLATLLPGLRVTSSIDAYRDHDWFRVALVGGTPYRFTLYGVGPGVPPALRQALRAADGTVLAEADRELTIHAPADGIYYLDVAAAWPDQSSHFAYAVAATPMLGLTITPIVARAPEGAAGEATTYSFRIAREYLTGSAMTFGVHIMDPHVPIELAGLASIGTQPGATLVHHGGGKTGTIDFAAEETERTLFVTLWGNDLPNSSSTFHVSILAPVGVLDTVAVARARIDDDEPVDGIDVRSAATSAAVVTAPAHYNGPMHGVEREFITATDESLNIAVGGAAWFIRTGAGDDAIATGRGTYVIDAGGGSNFIGSEPSQVHVVLDPRGATAPGWSTIANFGALDSVAVMGIAEATHHLIWTDDQGEAGHRGLTLHALAADGPTTSITLPGRLASELHNGSLTAGFHTQEVTGTPYLFIAGGNGLPWP
jgi:hypothetical protein